MGKISGSLWIVESLWRQLVREVPGHPAPRVERRLVGVTLQRGEVIVCIHVGLREWEVRYLLLNQDADDPSGRLRQELDRSTDLESVIELDSIRVYRLLPQP